MGTRKQFTPAFKPEAVQLGKGGSRPVSKLTHELGIRRNQLYKWREFQFRGAGTFPGSVARKECTAEMTRVKHELARAAAGHVKYAVAYFAKNVR